MSGFESTFVAKTDGDTLKFYIGDGSIELKYPPLISKNKQRLELNGTNINTKLSDTPKLVIPALVNKVQ